MTGSAVDSITFSSLDGDTDKLYLMVFYWKIGGAAASTYSLKFKPNNVTTNQNTFARSTSTSATAVGSIGGGAGAGWTIGSELKGSEIYMKVHCAVHKSTLRLFSAEGTIYTAAGGVYVSEQVLHWSEVATNLTSIVLAGSSTGNIDVGSEFHLYKYTV